MLPRPSSAAVVLPEAAPVSPDPRHAPRRSPAALRRSTRRNRLVLAGSVVAAIAIVAAWFPTSDLVHERAQLDAQNAALQQIDQQNAALHRKEHQLLSPASAGRIAAEQYGLVTPGEQAYQVLPVSSANGAHLAGASDGSNARSANAPAGGPTSTGGGFSARVIRSLEFWR